MNTRNLTIKTVIISYLVFFWGWTLRVVCVDLSGMNEFLSWVIGFLIHVVWWPLFAFVLIKRYSNYLNISLKEMITTKLKLKILLPLLVFALVYNIAGFFIDSSGFGTKMKLYDLVVTAITVGIFEESVFRGWFLNSISTFVSERKANLISSALFVLIHYPGWIFAGYELTTIIITSLSVYALGLIFGWVFRKNRSIWTGAILHSAWDLITWVL
ncbi:MAG: CPBP family intramembrane glutamic endopeptidase [Candidatus Ornithomonoglobus sp.]